MKLKDLLPGCGAYGEVEVTGVTNDSRNVREGYAFVCVTKGPSIDAHDYALDAERAGASIIVAKRDTGAKTQLLVEDPQKAYAVMCANYFGNPAKRLKLIGITGTNGKTSTSLFVKSILERLGCKVGLIGTIQNMVGEEILPARNTTPDAYELHSLLSLMDKSGCDYVVMEVSSHSIDQDRIYGLQFACAVFTNLSQDHLDYHRTMENYLAAKQKLFLVCSKAVVNLDDPYAEKILEACDCETVTFSINSDESSYSAKNIRHRPDGVDFELVGDGVIGRVRMRIPGQFTVYNAMAAGVCVLSLGFPFLEVLDALSKANGVKGRVEVVPTGRDFTVIIDYAHTPDGLENILTALGEVKTGRLVTLFGCGGDRDATKRPIMGKIAAQLSDFVIVTSDNPRNEDPDAIIGDILEGMKGLETPYIVIENRIQAIDYAIKNAKKEDVILLAGKGHETYQILRNGTIRLDEREVVAKSLSQC